MKTILPLALDIRWDPRRPPYATLGLIALMGLMHFVSFVGMEFFGWGPDWRWDHWALTRSDPVPTEFVTSVLGHGSFRHWFFNSFYLFVFGSALENRVGWKKLLFFFFVAGASGDLVEVALYYLAFGFGGEISRSIGSSGAVCAIMGLAAARFYRNKLTLGDGVFTSQPIPLFRFGVPLRWFVWWRIGLDIYGMFEGVGRTNHLAHLLGFGAGFWLARRFGIAKDGKDDVVWDQARDDLEKGWWKQALPKLREVLARRPEDLEVRGDLLRCLHRLRHPNPERPDPLRDEARALLDASLCMALIRGDKAWAWAQLKDAAPGITPYDLSDKCRLMLKAAGMLEAGPPTKV